MEHFFLANFLKERIPSFKALKKIPSGISKIELQDIQVVDVSHHVISLIQMMINTGKNIFGIRFSKNAINGKYIDDAFIYRMQSKL
ncbi:hypothetical protein GMMP1_450001 [Candidatus Magnetomoraceae bacterium gMMP-1]